MYGLALTCLEGDSASAIVTATNLPSRNYKKKGQIKNRNIADAQSSLEFES